MQQQEEERGAPIGPLDWLRRVPFAAAASSDGLGWVGLEASRFRAAPGSELHQPAISYHRLFLVTRPPEELDLIYDNVKRHVPLPAGSISLVPAGTPALWRWSGPKDTLNIYLKPGLLEQVATEAFDLDPARVAVPPLEGLDLPQLRAAMEAVDAELTAGGAAGPLAAEALANVLAVQLIRHVSAPRQPTRRRDGTLPRAKLRAVVEYIEEHLDAGPTLEEMAAVAHLSAYHFARQFKAATGLPPHEYVITRRVERARQFLQGGSDLTLAQIAAQAGFSDQSQFSRHFKRILGVTPGQFRMSAKIA